MSDVKSDVPNTLPAVVRAAADGDLAALEAILAENPSALNEADSEDFRAIHWAALKGQLPCLRALLAAGADPGDAHGPSRSLPLSLAAYRGHVPVVKALLEAGADLEATCPFIAGLDAPVTALQWAVMGGQEGSLRALLAAGASLEPQPSGPCLCSLHLAAMFGHAGCMRLLLEAGAAVDAQDANGETALIKACQQGRLACVKTLLAAGADLEARSAQGTALAVALDRSQADCATALLAAGACTGPLGKQRLVKLQQLATQAVETVRVAQLRQSLESRRQQRSLRQKPGTPAGPRAESQDVEAAQAAAAAAAAEVLAEEERQGQAAAARAAARAAKRQRQKARRQQRAGDAPAGTPQSTAGPAEPLQQGLAAAASPPADTASCAAAHAAAGVPTPPRNEEPSRASICRASSWRSSEPHAAACPSDEEEVEGLMKLLGLSGSDSLGCQAAGIAGRSAEAGTSSSAGPAAAPACASLAAPLASSSPSLRPLSTGGVCPGASACLDDLACPITQETMQHPVLAADGHTYECAAIQAWIERQEASGKAPRSPLTGLPLGHADLVPNRELAMQIQELCAAGAPSQLKRA